MILDKDMLIADDLAHNGTPTAIDLGAVRPGPGQPIKMFVRTSATMAGATGIVITDGATSAAADAHSTITMSLNGGAIEEFELPSDISRYVKVSLAGTTTAGTWSCGVVLPGVQTNK